MPDIYYVYTLYMVTICKAYPVLTVTFNFGKLNGTLWKLEELETHACSMVAQDNNLMYTKDRFHSQPRYSWYIPCIYHVYTMYIPVT